MHQACQPPEGGFSGASYVVKCRNRGFRRNTCALRNCSPVRCSLDFGVFCVAARRVFVTGMWGYQPGMYQHASGGSFVSMLITGAMLHGRKRKLHWLKEAESGRPRKVQWDFIRWQLVF